MISAKDVSLTPKLLTGKIVDISEMCVKIELKGKMGIVNLPLRCIITDKPLELDAEAELYISYIRVL
ncbi:MULTISPECIES: CBO2463/CBO2479 domain-containing protein [unclassified Sedimentibacter]|uniref:CBO2463/CBO2479 domain-containing protein n=1 Tax=unclassified Sedimentibacter TaxID=2649220 RepID=UPI001BD533F9|nr:CBO2463/CBO2479 domain-containing protein [Sedimentibacter sp. MB35-C1]WMJ77071.1 CBO2463/CBO2479 domain-containing protein [Sedimentibacter sp. MB35-C1]